MKKILIGLLVIAAAGTSYYLYSRSKKPGTTSTSVDKNLVLGKWKTAKDASSADTAQTLYQYEFQKDGILLRSVNDTIKADTVYYEWDKAGALTWKAKATDSTATVYTVVKLTSDSLELKNEKASAGMLLTKLK